MPASPAMRFSPGRESRADNHKRGRSLENGMVFKERDDDLALFNVVQSREKDNFLLQSNDDFEDTFVTKLRDFSDHKLGINIGARGESSDFLNTEEEKNDYEWLITPPDTPLFSSLDDETPQIIVPQRGRPRGQPISISRSSTMEKSHRSSRSSQSPNRLTTFQPKSQLSSPPPPTLRPTTGSKRPSSPSTKPSRRLSTGSTTTTTTRGISGISPIKTTTTTTKRGNSASPKIKAWQANIPGFSTEAPPNLRTSLADRPASYVRGSSPASRNSRQSMSPTPSRSISSSHSHDRDRFSPRSKRSFASSGDDDDDDDVDVESLPSVAVVDGSQRLNSKKVSGFRNNNNNYNNNNNKGVLSQKGNRTVSSINAPKRSFDMALRQMDQKRVPQNMFRPLLTSVPSSTLYAGKPTTPVWNSSVTTSSNASSYAHEIQETETNDDDDDDDDATSEYTKVPNSTTLNDDQVFICQKTDSFNENTENETHENSPNLQKDEFENLADCDTETSVVLDDFKENDGLQEDETVKDMLICSRCGCKYSDIIQTEKEIKLCENCQKLSDEEHESYNILKSEMNPIEVEVEVEVESLELIQFEKHEDLVKDTENTFVEEISNMLSEKMEEKEVIEFNHQVLSQPSYSDTGSDQIQNSVDFLDSKVDLKKSNSMKGVIVGSGNFSASSISYDDFSYVRDSTNSVRSSLGRGSFSASSSFDFGQSTHTDIRFNRQLSNKKSEIENYKNHRRSVSSFSGNSSHVFHPSSVGTSTLDSFEVSSVRVSKDLADVASSDPQENLSCENDTCNEISQTTHDLLPESLNFEEVVSFEKVEDLEKDESEEDTSLNVGVEEIEDELSVISEGEIGQTCSFGSECNVSENIESKIEELEDNCDLNASGKKDVTTLAMDGDTSNHATGIIEESLVVIEGEGKTKGRSLTLEEATDTILFCSSIVHNLAYEAATLSIQKQTPPHSDTSGNIATTWPLIPVIEKPTKEVQTKTTKKQSSKSKKIRKKKATKKPPNNTNTSEETDLGKPRIVYPNNKENRRPLELESKCNCSVM